MGRGVAAQVIRHPACRCLRACGPIVLFRVKQSLLDRSDLLLRCEVTARLCTIRQPFVSPGTASLSILVQTAPQRPQEVVAPSRCDSKDACDVRRDHQVPGRHRRRRDQRRGRPQIPVRQSPTSSAASASCSARASISSSRPTVPARSSCCPDRPGPPSAASAPAPPTTGSNMGKAPILAFCLTPIPERKEPDARAVRSRLSGVRGTLATQSTRRTILDGPRRTDAAPG